MPVEDFADVMKRANRIGAMGAKTPEDGMHRALALGLAALRSYEQTGLEGAESVLRAAAISAQHRAAGRTPESW